LPDWSGRVVATMVEDLFKATQHAWSQEVSKYWCLLLERKQQITRSYRPGALEVQAVQMSLAETSLPLSQVLLATFPRVYETTVAGSVRSIFDMFPFYADWDKGKELRRKLIDAYTYSAWPPGDLPLIASSSNILAKVVSRSLRIGRQEILYQALDDLRSRKGQEEITVARHLSELLRQGKVEDWD
jgi:hypothetical protein